MKDFKVLLVGINTKFSHTNLAIRYLKNMIIPLGVQAQLFETNISNHPEDIIRSIYDFRPNLLAFSCYIWNMELVLKICQSIKKIIPNLKIVLGGPEVSFEGVDFFENHPYIDYIIKGEGEIPFKKLVKHLSAESLTDDIEGLLTKDFDNGVAQAVDLSEIPFPYGEEDLEALKNQIIYYEASRGCPFNCTYCLSSTTKGVRSLEINRVKRELILLSQYASLVKFVDRTFNCNAKTTVELLRFIKDLETDVTFHLEISAHLITPEILSVFKDMPKNRVQLEIGVQTTNAKSVKSIQRSTDFHSLSRVVSIINSFDNIHQHLDLIAGLPFEDYQSFKKSFNDVMALSPHKLQLGFLKLLKGSQLRKEKEVHQYNFNDFPPYEVLDNKYMSFSELSHLKQIEHLLETYYNSHRFDKTIGYLHQKAGGYFETYEKLYHYFKENRLSEINHSLNDHYRLLLEFGIKVLNIDKDIFTSLVKFDYLTNRRTHTLPDFLGENAKIKERVFEFLKVDENIRTSLPNFVGIKPSEIYKQIIVEKFNYNPISESHEQVYLLFNYQLKEGIFEKPSVIKVQIS